MKYNKAMVSSISGKFESYTLSNVVAVQFVKGIITLTYIDKDTITPIVSRYDSEDVIINIA